MTRLIDADALIKDLEYDVELDAKALDDTDLLLGRNREIIQFDKDCKQNAIDMLKKAPTVDAEPVRHGKWIPEAYDDMFCCCSECGTHEYRETIEVLRYDFCPYCGAKMERKEE